MFDVSNPEGMKRPYEDAEPTSFSSRPPPKPSQKARPSSSSSRRPPPPSPPEFISDSEFSSEDYPHIIYPEGFVKPKATV